MGPEGGVGKGKAFPASRESLSGKSHAKAPSRKEGFEPVGRLGLFAALFRRPRTEEEKSVRRFSVLSSLCPLRLCVSLKKKRQDDRIGRIDRKDFDRITGFAGSTGFPFSDPVDPPFIR
jgi:hypothetical protein